MACFLIPAILAVITLVAQKTARGLAEKLKLWVLDVLLWGGVILLALEHAWHGELVPWPPFLTVMANPADIPIMLHEMATIGTAMSIATISTWIVILAINRYMEKFAMMGVIKPVKESHVLR